MKYIFLSIALTMCLGFTPDAYSRSFRPGQIPNGTINSCNNCHASLTNSARNVFGTTIENSFLSGGDVTWNSTLANLDSDGDGFSNGVELQDAAGAWVIGMPAPGDQSNVSNPGRSSSIPTSIVDEDVVLGLTIGSISPNPFVKSVVIDYNIAVSGFINANILDINGKIVKTLISEYQFAGENQLFWDGSDNSGNYAGAGKYFISLVLNNKTITKSIVFIK